MSISPTVIHGGDIELVDENGYLATVTDTNSNVKLTLICYLLKGGTTFDFLGKMNSFEVCIVLIALFYEYY